MTAEQWRLATSVKDVRENACVSLLVDGHTLALFAYGDAIHAVDNRCPHMGFPLKDGSIKDGILTCHWHHARFDLTSGGAFDLWTDDVRSFPTDVRDGQVWVDIAQHRDELARQELRLHDGLERNLPLVIAKSVITLADEDHTRPFRIGLDFGTRFRQNGWGQGLTILTCMMNLLPHLSAEDRPRALYHGLSAVANDVDGSAARFMVQPLPNATTNVRTLKRWLRQFVEVRDTEGAERCIVSAVHAGATQRELADMLFAAVTDRRYIQTGHPLDFTNKALDALDTAGWDQQLTAQVLTSLIPGYTSANRMEESNAWRNPIDLIALLEKAFVSIDTTATATPKPLDAKSRQALIDCLLSDDPNATLATMLSVLQHGCTELELASVVVYSAGLRIARFHTSNEFTDWDTALHTFTFANAVHQGLRRLHAQDTNEERSTRTELLRGVFDAAMSIYLDRFLNVPAARIPSPVTATGALDQLAAVFDTQQQVNAAAEVVAAHMNHSANAPAVIAMLGRLLLREDRDFHTIQALEAAVRQHSLQADDEQTARHFLIAASRYQAAHAPTMRAQGQTFNIALRLARGDHLFEA